MIYRQFLYLVLSPLVGFFAILLNNLEIFFILKRRKLKKAIFFLNLAASDTFLGIVIVTVKAIVFTKPARNSSAFQFAIFIQRAAVDFSIIQSILCVMLITCDRILLIKLPFHYNRLTTAKKSITCLLTWVLSIVITVVLTKIQLTVVQRFFVYAMIVVLMFVAVGTSYVVIFKTMNNASNRRTNSGFVRTERKFIRLCVYTNVAFVFCWMPFIVIGMKKWALQMSHETYLNLNYTAYILAFSNSIINPLLFFHYTNFVSAKKLLCRAFSLCKESRNKMKHQFSSSNIAITTSTNDMRYGSSSFNTRQENDVVLVVVKTRTDVI